MRKTERESMERIKVFLWSREFVLRLPSFVTDSIIGDRGKIK